MSRTTEIIPNESSPNPQEGYMPGKCNIGKKEIEQRKRGALFSFLLCILFIAGMQWFKVDPIWKLLLFIPAASFGVGFQQWILKFCVGFGMKGVFNFGDIGKTFSVAQKENLKKDRIKARQMIISGILFGAVTALAFYYWPF